MSKGNKIKINKKLHDKMMDIIETHDLDFNDFINDAIKYYIKKEKYLKKKNDSSIEIPFKKAIRVSNLTITLSTGEVAEAIAVNEDTESITWMFKDCLTKPLQMNLINEIETSYHKSHLRYLLNTTIFESFPDDVKSLMLPVYEKDKIRIPYENEIFGCNTYGIDDLDSLYFQIFEDNEDYRIANINGEASSYWLIDEHHEYCGSFCTCTDKGTPGFNFGAYENGVRPIFKLKKMKIGE